jgi:amicoumacin kinase
MDPSLLKIACNLYNTSPDELIPQSGGHTNAVYQFPLTPTSQPSRSGEVIDGDQYGILRIGAEDCPFNQTMGMLEWVSYLAQHGAPVSAPLRSINNHLMERVSHYGTVYNLTVFEKAEGILAENIPVSEWSPELFQSIGKAAGKLHRISAEYKPSHPSRTRPQWFDSYEIHDATQKLAATTDPTREKLSNLIVELQQLPRTDADFGLLHEDLHYANFLIHPGGEVTIIDFDDCSYGWYAMDVAMALFDVLVLYDAGSEEENQGFACQFFSSYLAGYRQEKNLPIFWQAQIPKFLKLKELCIYADLIGHADISQPDSWVGRFMRQRSTRIAGDLPYVDIDFTSV